MERLIIIGGFALYCLVLAMYGNPKEKPAWLVLAVFALIDMPIELMFPDGFGSFWGPISFGVRELIVINALFLFAWNRFGQIIAGVVGLFWVAHLCLYLDLNEGSKLIYDHYEWVIKTLIAVIITLGLHGVIGICKKCVHRLHRLCDLGGRRLKPSRASGRCQIELEKDKRS